MASIDSLSIEISASAGKAITDINNLCSALTRLSETMNKIDPSSAEKAVKMLGGIGNAVSTLGAGAKNLKNVTVNLNSIGEASVNVENTSKASQDLSNVAQEMAQNVGEATKVIKDAANGSSSLANAQKAAKSTISALKAGYQGFTSTLKKTGTWFKKIASHALRAASNISIFGKSSKSSKNSVSSLVKELTRIAKMLKLMITRMVLRKVIQGVLDGFKNLAQYSTTFDAALSLLWNDFRQLGNSISAAVSPLIKAFAPAIHYIIQLCIQAVNAINQLLSALTGLGKWTRAKSLTDSYAKSLEKAGGAAKELKKTVLGFDELNQLQDNKNSGGGGTSPADMFEEAPIDKKWADWAKKIKDMWKTGDFTELGKAIGEWLLNALNSIPWNKIKKTARKIGKSIATLLNGFVEVKGLGYAIGKTLSEAINTAFEFLNEFVHQLHWDSIGKFIGDTLNGLFENIDWPLIKDTVVTGLAGVAKAIQEAINEFHWDNISKTLINGLDVVSAGIKEFFEGIEWGDLGQKMGDQLAKTIKGAPWTQVGEAIGSAIQAAIDWVSGFVDTLEVQDVVNALSDMLSGFFEKVDPKQAGENLGKILQFLIDTIKGFWEENHDDVLQAVKDFFSGLFSKVDKVDLMKIVAGILGFALLNGVTSLTISAVSTALAGKIAGAITGAAAAEGVAGAGAAAGSTIGLLIVDGIAAVMGGALGLAVFEPIKRNLWNLGEEIAKALGNDEAAEKIHNMHEAYNQMDGSLDMIKDGFKELYELLGGEVDRSVYKLTDDFGNTKKVVDDLGNTIIDFTDHSDALKSSIGDLSVTVTRDLGQVDNSIHISDSKAAEAFRNMKNNVADVKFEPLSNAANSMKNSVTIDFEQVDNAVANTNTFMSGQVHEISQNVDGMANDIQTSTDTIKDSFSEDKWTFSGVWEGLKKTFENAKESIKGVWNSIADKLNGNHQIFGSSVRIDLPRFASGGFIEDGLFTMNRGEIAGKFNNGKSVVANNEQITEGIARAVFNAMTSAQSSGSSQYINNTIMVDGDVIARAVTKGQERLNRRYSPTMA